MGCDDQKIEWKMFKHFGDAPHIGSEVLIHPDKCAPGFEQVNRSLYFRRSCGTGIDKDNDARSRFTRLLRSKTVDHGASEVRILKQMR